MRVIVTDIYLYVKPEPNNLACPRTLVVEVVVACMMIQVSAHDCGGGSDVVRGIGISAVAKRMTLEMNRVIKFGRAKTVPKIAKQKFRCDVM